MTSFDELSRFFILINCLKHYLKNVKNKIKNKQNLKLVKKIVYKLFYISKRMSCFKLKMLVLHFVKRFNIVIFNPFQLFCCFLKFKFKLNEDHNVQIKLDSEINYKCHNLQKILKLKNYFLSFNGKQFFSFKYERTNKLISNKKNAI